MGQNNIIITKEVAESFAHLVRKDVAAYVKLHQEEFQQFLLEEGSEENVTKRKPRKSNKHK